jgi:hypothetical protein
MPMLPLPLLMMMTQPLTRVFSSTHIITTKAHNFPRLTCEICW